MIASYLITDPLFYTQKTESFSNKLLLAIKYKKPDFALLRDKSTNDYESLAKVFVQTLKPLHVKSILHSDIDLALSLGAYGVHLPFTCKDKIQRAKKEGLYVICSTHAIDEAKEAQTLGADALTYSPIFATPGKGKPVGLEKLKEIVGILSIDIFALGGIVSEAHIDACAKAGAFGFASIRYFLPSSKGNICLKP